LKDKDFWKKFKELREKHRAEQEAVNQEYLLDFEFNEVVRIVWITFDKNILKNLGEDEYTAKITQIKNRAKKCKINIDEFIYEGFINIEPFEAKFVKYIDSVIPIYELFIEVRLIKRK